MCGAELYGANMYKPTDVLKDSWARECGDTHYPMHRYIQWHLAFGDILWTHTIVWC